jgi:Rieske Fe-S protein
MSCACLDRGRRFRNQAGSGDQDELAQAAGVHPQSDPGKEIAKARCCLSASCAIRRRWPNATKPGKENWLITMGVCTHLGCVPLGAASG